VRRSRDALAQDEQQPFIQRKAKPEAEHTNRNRPDELFGSEQNCWNATDADK
jgi:hypothetical protein